MNNMISCVILLLLSFFVAPVSAQAISYYQSPNGQAYAYDQNCTLQQLSVSGTGQAPNTTIVTLGSTFELATYALGSSLVFAVEGLAPASTALNFGQYALVGSVLQTVPMTWDSGGGYWYHNFAIGTNPALVGIHLFYQCATLFTSNSCNDYATTDGVTFTIQ